jgi:hypothetical protein
MRVLDHRGRLEAIHVGQAEVHEHDVGLVVLGQRDAFGGRGGPADTLDVGLVTQRDGQQVGDRLVVVDHQHPHVPWPRRQLAHRRPLRAIRLRRSAALLDMHWSTFRPPRHRQGAGQT